MDRAYNIKAKIEPIIYSIVLAILAGIFVNIGLMMLTVNTTTTYNMIGFITFIICAVSGFIIIPTLITNRIYGKNILKRSQGIIDLRRSIVLFILICPLGYYLGGLEKTIFFLLIAICEEFLFRHIIFNVLKNDNTVFMATFIGSIIFATILHANYNLIDNLLIRAPFSMIFYYLTQRYKLQDAIGFHWIYNIIVTTI